MGAHPATCMMHNDMKCQLLMQSEGKLNSYEESLISELPIYAALPLPPYHVA